MGISARDGVSGSTYPVWGWGGPEQAPDRAELEALAPTLEALLGFAAQPPERPLPLEPLPVPRRRPPSPLEPLASDAPLDRARHGLGRSYRDVVRGLRGRVDHPPDLVLRPRSDAEVAAVLDWCGAEGVAVVPFGGGTSVVGGVEPAVGDGFAAVVSLDLAALSGVVEVDAVARAARVRAGTPGPALERQLGPHGLTMRFFPQSFERSTVGGWLATRAAGHFATGPTHIDDLVESVRMVTPAGVLESRRLPGSGAGPSPDRLALGSEGTLGVITEAWLRVLPRPERRAAALLAFESFQAGAAAVRALVQAGLRPATCRLLDPAEAALSGTLAGGEAALLLGVESAVLPADGELELALELAGQAGGRVLERGERAGGSWRSSFRQAPQLRDRLVLLGVLVETFETAVTWERLEALVAGVRQAAGEALRRVCGAGRVTCRLTHVYPDGAAPYFTVLAPARRGSELEQWAEVKAAASEAVLAAGGTITHHHAVGRDHRPWYDRQRPDPFALALRAAKAALDPAGVLNPGVLVDPRAVSCRVHLPQPAHEG
ncbi:MAG TPA: FAD-binding oxidoreductase [Actinomycetota bacterium]|jgi:alkyldihydroxyacetonephosphate synthase|nr:FAD-binding oxidoreductase [Actinomycetota bacterium]